MHMELQTEPFRVALAAAEAQLGAIEEQFQALTHQREKLKITVGSLRSLLGTDECVPVKEDVQEASIATTVPNPRRGPSDTSAWKVSRDVFGTTSNQPLSLQELQLRLADRGFNFDLRTIRSGMARKTDVFEQVAFGKWHVKSFTLTHPDSDHGDGQDESAMDASHLSPEEAFSKQQELT